MGNLKLTGVSYGQVQEVITNQIIGNQVSTFTIVRDENNEHDQHAVRVVCKGDHLGWVPKSANIKLAEAMDTGRLFQAELKDVLQHSDYPTKGVVINIIEVR